MIARTRPLFRARQFNYTSGTGPYTFENSAGSLMGGGAKSFLSAAQDDLGASSSGWVKIAYFALDYASSGAWEAGYGTLTSTGTSATLTRVPLINSYGSIAVSAGVSIQIPWPSQGQKRIQSIPLGEQMAACMLGRTVTLTDSTYVYTNVGTTPLDDTPPSNTDTGFFYWGYGEGVEFAPLQTTYKKLHENSVVVVEVIVHVAANWTPADQAVYAGIFKDNDTEVRTTTSAYINQSNFDLQTLRLMYLDTDGVGTYQYKVRLGAIHISGGGGTIYVNRHSEDTWGGAHRSTMIVTEYAET
jgi:hypothetical protein